METDKRILKLKKKMEACKKEYIKAAFTELHEREKVWKQGLRR